MAKCTQCMRGDCCGGDFEELEAENKALKKHTALLNREYNKAWEVLRTYNPSDIELKYIGFEDVK